VAEGDEYRALSGTAIAAAAVAAFAPLAFLGWWLLPVAATGVVLGGLAWWDIVRRPGLLTGRRLALGATIVSSACLVGGGAYRSMVYASELPAGHERLSYGPLQPAPGEPAHVVPATAREFDGREVLIKGYMYPGKQQSGIVQFLLVRDQGDCCFGGNPKITDRVLVQMADPSGIAFTARMRKLAGRFRVEPTGTAALDGGVFYHLDDARLRE